MKLVEKLEYINNSIDGVLSKIANSTDSTEIETLTAKANALRLERESLQNSQTDKGEKIQMKNYLETNEAVNEFINAFRTSQSARDAHQKWNDTLKANGVEFDDKLSTLPKRIVTEIQTVLTRSNPVFPLFRVTNNGGSILARELTSTDGANIHKPGEQKTEQSATLKISKIDPVMIYKLQSVHEYTKRNIADTGELFSLLIAELSQAIIDKIVKLALTEGTAVDGGDESNATQNGFIAIKNETNENKVQKVAGKENLLDALSDAVDFVTAPGKKYLILTTKHVKAIVAELRKATPSVFIPQNAKTVKDAFDIDEVIVLPTTNADLTPTVLAQDAYHVDMDSLTRVEAFEWKTNENVILVETLATGRLVAYNGAAVVTL